MQVQWLVALARSLPRARQRRTWPYRGGLRRRQLSEKKTHRIHHLLVVDLLALEAMRGCSYIPQLQPKAKAYDANR